MLTIVIGLAAGWRTLDLADTLSLRSRRPLRSSPSDGLRSKPRHIMHDRIRRRSAAKQFIFVVGATMALIAHSARADLWYEHYVNAEQALEERNWTLAVQEINEALQKKGDSGARVRTYGMNVTSYFPYLKLGVAYYHLGQLDAAQQAFETEARLGAIEEFEAESADLERYRALVQEGLVAAAEAEQARVRRIVEQSLSKARELEAQGRLNEAMAALDQALAVAPLDVDAQTAMAQLRDTVMKRERELERQQRATQLVADGKALLRERRYSEATSAFRQALFLQSDPGVQKLLETAQQQLVGELETDRALKDGRAAIGAKLNEVRALQAAGQLATALDKVESILALAPSNQDALTIQGQLLRLSREAEEDRARQATIGQLLAEANSQIAAESAEEALSAANAVLALDPGNDIALQHVARAYGMISRKLLGTQPRGNIPPAVRFVDLRQEGDNGELIETINAPDFRLNGVIIDNSPVDVTFYLDDDRQLQPRLASQPLGEFHITEFNIESRLAPGLSTFRLVVTDSEGLSSSSQYSVLYTRPLHRRPLFYVVLFGFVMLLGAAVMWEGRRRREQLRKRRFNPYIAGAPILDDSMFFGRHELVDRILQTIHNNSLLIYGERRIGKTSIQHQLKKRLRQLDDPKYEFFPVYVDLQGTPETRFFQTIAEEIFQELEPELEGLRPVQQFSENYSYRDFVRDLRTVLKSLQEQTAKQAKLVLLIDEVDELNAYNPRINQKLRSLFMKNFSENLVTVVSGVEIKKQWEGEGSPWYNFFEEIEVKPFGPQDARKLIQQPIARIFKMDGGVVEKIIMLTGGRPYQIQKMCISLVTRLHEQHRRKITVADVEAVVRSVR